MSKTFMRICSMIVVLTMMVNMLPIHALADEVFTSEPLEEQEQPVVIEQEIPETSETVAPEITTEEAQIIEEIKEDRTEFSKNFKLSNGLYMVAVYPDAVHFEKDGEWEEIDNTLILSEQRSGTVYTTTAGNWQVSFPQEITGSKSVVISEGDYSLRFAMVGQLRNNGHAVMKAEEEAELMEAVSESDSEATLNESDALETGPAEVSSELTAITEEIEISTDDPPVSLENEAEAVKKFIDADVVASDTIISTANVSLAKIEALEREAMEGSKMEKLMPQKLNSRLRYEDIYANTDIIYDLKGNQVKESIVMEQYEANLRGFSYILETGAMIAVLTEENNIELYDPSGENLLMVMPAPYLFDSAGEYCYDVGINLKKVDDYYALSYVLPQSWMADENRVWPVVLDPVVNKVGNHTAAEDHTVSERVTVPYNNTTEISCGYSPTTGEMECYLKYTELPHVLTSADVIVDANLEMCCIEGNSSSSVVELHKVTAAWQESTLTWSNRPAHDSNIEDYAVCSLQTYSSWDVTDLVREWYTGTNNGVMFKLSNTDISSAKSSGATKYKSFFCTEFGNDAGNPILTITYRNNNGLESYWDYTTTSAGRAGTGYVNQYTGNLVWIKHAMGYDGNRMPVSIELVYNANDSANNSFGIGYGWRTNYNQRVYQWSVDNSYYVWEDSDGTKHYFKYSSANTYRDEDGLELTLKNNGSDPKKFSITDKYGNVSYFNSAGYLYMMENNQQTKSNITLTYDSSNRITNIKDGANRNYALNYSSGLLNKIIYKGTGTTALETVTLGYSSSHLEKVTDQDGKICKYTYDTSKHLLLSAQDIDGYMLEFDYTSAQNTTEGNKIPRRVAKITETHNGVTGGILSIAYAQNQTTFTDVSGNVQVVQFNNWGNTMSVQDGQGRAQSANYGTNDPTEVSSDASVKANQLRVASKMQNTVKNYLPDSSFEGSTLWSVTTTAVTRAIASAASTAYHGTKSLKLTRASAGTQSAGVYTTVTAEKNSSYTFSAYVKGTAYLELNDGTTTYTGEPPASSTEWSRLEISYTNTSASSKTLYLRLMTKSAGTTYMDCVQFEKMPTASRYNLVQNGDFSTTSNWSSSSGRVSMSSAAPQLDATVYKMTGNPSATNRITQTIQVSGVAGDSFVLGGWAMAKSVPLTTTTREFAVVAVFNNTNGTTTTHKARFNPYVDNWQYASTGITADTAFSSVTIRLDYDYNANTVYFDGIQFFKEELGYSYVYDEDGNITSTSDYEGNKTEYTYDDKNDLTKVTYPDDTSIQYVYDNYHNVTKMTSRTGIVTTYTYDGYGNLLSTTVGGKMTTSNTYRSDNSNQLASTTDAVGNTTQYATNPSTGLVSIMRSPMDTISGTDTRTKYSYDTMRRLKTVTKVINNNTTLTASYDYTNDYLTKITTGSTIYDFKYGNFGLRSSVTAGGNSLASYSYAANTHYLTKLDYGNGDSVIYNYNQQGDVTLQKYEDNATVTYKYNNSGYLASTTDSASGITTTYYYDLSERIGKYRETGTGLNHSVQYTYDDENNLTALREIINGTVRNTSYTYDSGNRIATVATGDANETYGYDTTYGRLSTKTTKNGSTTVLTDKFTYRNPTSTTTSGQVTELKSTANGYNATYTYAYNANGNITSVSVGGKTTTYVYDSANQLIRENNQAANKTWIWTYDDAGNIQNRKEYTYTTADNPSGTPTTVEYEYSTSTWGDLLTSFRGQSVGSDAIGNITSVAATGRSYIWKHGRQLASSTYNGTWTYTYNADGMRVKRTNGSTTYSYVYNGSTLSQMTVGSNTLYFAYDASGSPMAVTYNNNSYYYATNLQGDVVAILDTSGNAVVTYLYDAWGNILSTTGSKASTLGKHNPLRYRGYVYDEESKLYYLQSRYYDPEMGRFLNHDIVYDNDAGLQGLNLFAYCGNTPIIRVDTSGQDSGKIEDLDLSDDQMSERGAGASSCSSPGASTPFIYRYGKPTPGNLTPKAKDVNSGLSFSTIPRGDSGRTTIEAINSSGILKAFQDGPTHVSVVPTNGSMQDWISGGKGSAWTTMLIELVERY